MAISNLTWMTTFFEHQRTVYKRSYLRNLICLASTDGSLDDSERDLIQEIGLRRGLKRWQVADLLNTADRCENIFIPQSVSNQMMMLYDLMQIIHADNQVKDQEIEYIDNLLNEFNLHRAIVNELKRMFQGTLPSAGEWRDFATFVNDDVILQDR